jgi:hypothetical protein
VASHPTKLVALDQPESVKFCHELLHNRCQGQGKIAVTLCLSFQFIKLDFNLIFGVVPVEELTRMLLKPFVLFWCKWVRQLKHQVTLSRMLLWSDTDLLYLKSGLLL